MSFMEDLKRWAKGEDDEDEEFEDFAPSRKASGRGDEVELNIKPLLYRRVAVMDRVKDNVSAVLDSQYVIIGYGTVSAVEYMYCLAAKAEILRK